MTDLSQRIASLPADKLAELLARLDREREKGSAPSKERAVTSIPRRAEGETARLSFSQERLWFIDQLEGGRTIAYNVSATLALVGPLSRHALAQAYSEVARRHEVLRTTFEPTDEAPVQRVWPAGPMTVPRVDLTRLAAADREAEGRRLAVEERARAVDLLAGPVIRMHLVMREEARHMVLFTMHHIASDGWSVDVLLREMVELYRSFAAGEPSPFEELPIQYADFAIWQRARQDAGRFEEEVDWWRDRLAGSDFLLELPLDRPRPPVQSARGANLSFEVPARVAGALRELCSRLRVTPFAACLAGYHALLFRYSHQTAFNVGTPVANRDRVETEGLIGFFIDTLVLAGDLDGEPGFPELVRRASDVVLEAQAHQELPFDRLIESLRPQRVLSHEPLFQVVIIFENQATSSHRIETAGLAVERVAIPTTAAQFDITLTVLDHPGGFSGKLHYRTDLFDRTTMERLARHYVGLLASALDRPETPIDGLDLMPAGEHHQVLVEAPARRTVPASGSLLDLWCRQVARDPAAPAVTFDLEELTYGELDARASRLAWHLVERGVGPEVRVGVLLERTLDLVVALLAVLRAGGAYVPLDPASPGERLDYILADAGASVVVTTGAFADELDPESAPLVVHLESDAAAIAEHPATAPEVAIDPDHLAYVIYTSGSTGRPKGVGVGHGQVVRLLSSTDPWFGFGPDDVWTLFHSYAFDFSVWELWGALCTGGRVVVVPYWVTRSPDAFHRLLRTEGVTVLNQTPSAFRQLIRAEERLAEEGESVDDLRLRYVIFGGEALEPGSLRPWVERHGLDAPRLVNMYGITETTVHVTYRVLGVDDLAAGARSVVGEAIPDLAVSLMDPHLRPVPLGVAGELCVGGAGVARGYLGRPALTAERFLPDPFSLAPGGRLYRSGDLARRVPTGGLEYLRRIDQQVKVRGFRIELGEIGARLADHPAVREAAVVPWDVAADDRRLAAYVVLGDPGTDESDLKEHLARGLPEYMVPSAWVFLDRLPLTVNGKLDRAALPDPQESLQRSDAFVPPRTALERRLAALWSELTGVERVGAEDDFFALGGHSLLATRMVGQIRARFGLEVGLRQVFEHPTLAGLAAELEGPAAAEAESFAPLPRVDRDGDLPLSFAQERLFFVEQLTGGTPGHNLVAAIRLRGTLRPAALAAALNDLVRRHEVLRTTFRTRDGQPFQVIHPDLPPEVSRVDLSGLDAARREDVLGALRRAITLRTFDLERGPLVRLTLVALRRDEQALILSQHHMVSDGVSLDLTIRELTRRYRELAEGSARGDGSEASSEAPEYADYAVWQRRHWDDPRRQAAELDWWREHLAGSVETLQLPTDRPRGSGPRVRGGSVSRRLDGAAFDRLRALGQGESASLFMIVLAGYQLLLGRYSHQERFSIGSTIAGRDHPQTEEMLGCFANVLVHPSRLDRSERFADLLASVRDAALAAYEHQDLRFEKLVESMPAERSLSQTPLFQVFLYQNPVREVPALPGLSVESVPGSVESIQFDLMLAVREGPASLDLSLQYSTDLFDATTAGRMLSHLTGIFAAVTEDPVIALREVPLLSAAERQQMVREWNRTARLDGLVGVHRMFAAHAAEHPAATAVVHEVDALSYGDLDAASDRLAAWLQDRGVGPGALVALLLERSLDLVVAVLGVLKAGGAYLPLDPAAPEERLRFILEDANAALVLTTGDLAEDLGESGAPVFLLDGPDAVPGEAVPPDAEPRDPGLLPSSLAYVIYTSGSTGRPKGVGVSHDNVVQLLLGCAEHFDFGADDVWTLFHSYAFDFSVWEIWGALAFGGQLVVVPYWVARSPDRFRRLLGQEGVTVLNQTPSAFRQLVEADHAADGPPLSLRWVVFGGEALDLESLAPWIERYGDGSTGGPRLVNMYGITETTVHVTFREVTEQDLHERHGSRIGGALPHLQAYLTDASLRLVPPGVVGEIVVGGGGLARGYLGRPRLTAERFVPDPFGTVPGARLYTSGDLARHREGGDLEYLWRRDRQVKVRGYRIELGEIESALREHPAVHEGVVVVCDGGDANSEGGERLVAYFTPRAGADAAVGTVRTHLKERLPEYMVPGFVVEMEAFPLNVNGKIDLDALPEPGDVSPETTGPDKPRSPVEEVLVELWRSLLGTETVGVESDFFELGGHSLLAARLLARVRELFDTEIPLRALFEEPTVAALARRIEGEAQAPLAEVLRPVPASERTALSFGQRQLWVLHQLEDDVGAYNVPAAVRLTGRLEPTALTGSIAEVRRRHEVLRTAFVEQAGEPRPVVRPAAGDPTRRVDLSGLAAEDRERAARSLAAADAVRSFDLGRSPMRSALLRLGSEEHVLLLTSHHIVSDEWSTGILVDEIAAIAGAWSRGEPSPLPEPELQYGDFGAWQRRSMEGEALEAQMEFWRRQISDLPPFLGLPTDRPRPTRFSQRGASVGVAMPPELAERLQVLCREAVVTPFMALAALFGTLLGRLSGQERFALGTPVGGRRHVETEALIGYFVNTLVLRVDLGARADLRTLLARVRESLLDAHAHQDLPFERLVEEVRPERSLSHSPIFQAMIVGLGDAPVPTPDLPGVDAEPLLSAPPHAHYDLTLATVRSGDGWYLSLEYATDLFDRTTVARWAEHLLVLAREAFAAPDRWLGALSPLTPAQRHQLLREWGDTERDRAPATLHGMVFDRARATPDATAVAWRGGAWSYGALIRAALALAGELSALGVGPEERVALCVERTPALAVGILGILSSGAAFLPVDPSYPEARVEAMLADAGVRVAVASDGVRDRLPEGPRILRLSPDGASIAGAMGTPPLAAPVEVSAGALAYTIFTSGSTGRPKGVDLEHPAAAAFVAETAPRFGLGPEDRFLQFASPGFDVVIEELFPAWSTGAAVVFPGEDLLGSYERFEETVAALRVTTVELPAPYWEAWVEALDRRGASPPVSLRRLLLGCERPAVERLRAWQRHGVPLIYVFGLTETAVTSSLHVLEAEDPVDRELAVGRPLGDVVYRVLDAAGGLTPLGCVGELVIGGSFLARGYLGDPAGTAARFVPASTPASAGGRFYRTGDRARWRTDGELEFLGRLDQQVKVRGFRVELAEVEQALERAPGVLRAVAGVQSGRLVGWVVRNRTGTGEGAAVTAEGLRARLRDVLPEYMVPGAIAVLDELPLTSSGKVDREALPEPTVGAADRIAPRDERERIIARLWSEVLNVDPVGVEDDFFALGGHSLLAIRLLSRVRRTFDVEVSLRSLFEEPTVSGLARAVAASDSSGCPAPTALVRQPRDGAPPLSFAQQRLWFIDRMDPGSPVYHIAAPVRIEGELSAQALHAALGEVMRRHEVLRTTFATVGDGPVQSVQVVHDPSPFRLPYVDLRGIDPRTRAQAVERIARSEASRPFDLTRDPMLRACLVRLGAAEHALSTTLHHVAGDEWSMGVLRNELKRLYAAYAQGLPSPLPELPVQYADFAIWQRSWLSGDVLEREVAWWRDELAMLPSVLELPTDRPRSTQRGNRAGVHHLRLADGTVEALEALARREGVTGFMIVLAAFVTLLSRLSGQSRVAVGSPVAGRTHLETEDLVGFFVNTLVFRGDLDGDTTFRCLLSAVRRTVLDGQVHQHLPFERLVEELKPVRGLSHTPIFQVLFNWEEVDTAEDRWGDLRVTPLPSGDPPAAFDLSLSGRTGDGIDLAFHQAADILDDTTAMRWLRQLVTLIEGALADPGARAHRLPMLSPAERHQTMIEWNDTRRDGAPPTLHGPVFDRARSTPDAVSLVWEDASWSYRSLVERALDLAGVLAALGAATSAPVALLTERTPEMAVGTLGILAAGAPYLPLDPGLPQARIETMIQDAGVVIAVAGQGLAGGLPGGLRAVELDRSGRVSSGGLRTAQPVGPAEPVNDALAYVMYTSGSTGAPKGVELSHGAAASFVREAAERFALGTGDRFLQFASPGFDVVVEELFPTWWSGGSVVLPGEDLLDSFERFELLVERRGVTGVELPAPYWEEWVHSLSRRGTRPPDSLRLVLLGCEKPSAGALRWWREHGPALTYVFGLTETAVTSSLHSVNGSGFFDGDLPIGRPLGNVTYEVLSAEGETAPMGVPGELFIGGPGLARGYRGQPAGTADRFVPAERNGLPGARRYRTGDRVRWRVDGEMEFLGRVDRQVKLRGFRVELAEIEKVLERSPEVRQAVADVRVNERGQERLIAWLVPELGDDTVYDDMPYAAVPSDRVRTASYRAACEQVLPEYMIPSAFIPIDEVPLTVTGKIDRGALPGPDAAPEDVHVGPRTPRELELAAIWEEILGVPRVGVHDDFFALGGHSLLALRLVGESERRLGVTLPVAELFRSPTIAALAATRWFRDSGAPAPATGSLVPLHPGGENAPWFLVHPIGGSVFGYAELARHLGADGPVWGVQSAALGGADPSRDIDLREMARRYAEVVRTVPSAGPIRLVGWSFGGLLAFEMARWLRSLGEAVTLHLLDPAPPEPEEGEERFEIRDRLVAFARDLRIGEADLASLAEALPAGAVDERGLESEDWRRLLGALADLGVWAPDLPVEELRTRFALFCAHQDALRAYRPPKPQPLAARIVCAADGDSDVAGWRRILTGGTVVVETDGDHYSMLDGSRAEALARRLVNPEIP